LDAIGDYAKSPLFTPAERAALAYAEEMCRTPVEVPDAVFNELRRHFNEPQIVELTAAIAIENLRARFNRALQIPSDGLCQLPESHPARRAAAAGQ
jgi:alkylhydroperoxidase family enzyme